MTPEETAQFVLAKLQEGHGIDAALLEASEMQDTPRERNYLVQASRMVARAYSREPESKNQRKSGRARMGATVGPNGNSVVVHKATKGGGAARGGGGG